jgi:hypothetical protein
VHTQVLQGAIVSFLRLLYILVFGLFIYLFIFAIVLTHAQSSKVGKDELIGEGVFNMTEKLKLNKDIARCYLLNNSVKFLYLKTKKSSLKNAILVKLDLISQILKYVANSISLFLLPPFPLSHGQVSPGQ